MSDNGKKPVINHTFPEDDDEMFSEWRIIIPITPAMVEKYRVCVWPPDDTVRDEIERRLLDGEEMEDILANPETFSF